MTATENKRLMEGIFDQLAQGDGKPFVDALAEDVRWTIIGGTAWSGTWQGLEAVRRRLLDPLFGQFETTYRAKAVRVIAEGTRFMQTGPGFFSTMQIPMLQGREIAAATGGQGEDFTFHMAKRITAGHEP